jgi:hypothetical protein
VIPSKLLAIRTTMLVTTKDSSLRSVSESKDAWFHTVELTEYLMGVGNSEMNQFAAQMVGNLVKNRVEDV